VTCSKDIFIQKHMKYGWVGSRYVCHAAEGRMGGFQKNFVNMMLGCTFRWSPLKKEGGEAENISNFEPFSECDVQNV